MRRAAKSGRAGVCIAERGEGPNVPVLPAVALTRALIRGDVEPGAGIARLPLQAIEAEMPAPALKITRAAIKADAATCSNAG